MELKRIVINKEIIIQKLSSNKNITKKIPKNDKTDFLRKCYRMSKSTERKHPSKKKTLSRLTKTKIASTNN